MSNQPQGLPPGVYLNLSMQAYHSDPAIGSTAIKNIMISDEEYWANSSANPDREIEDSVHFKYGTAYHQMVLEPETPFAFVIKKNPPDKPILKTTTEKGKIAEGQYIEMLKMYHRLLKNPMHWNLLQGEDCIKEASIFWRDEQTALMMKCRPDCWKPGYVTDLKTSNGIANTDMFFEFPKYHYHVSGFRYAKGMQALKKMIREGYQVTPEIPAEFIKSFMSHEKQIFCFVFQDKNSPYSTRARAMTPWASEQGAIIYNTALGLLKDFYDNPQYAGNQQPISYNTIEDIDEGDFYVSKHF